MLPDWHGFFRHLGRFILTSVVLLAVDLYTSHWWFAWLVFGWGLILILHFVDTLISGTEENLGLSNKTIQAQIKMATSYIKEIDNVVKNISNQTGQTHAPDLSHKLADWLLGIKELAGSVEQYQKNELIHQDIELVKIAIEDLTEELANQRDEAVRAELERALDNRQKQLAALENLQNMMKRAEIKIEATLSVLGIIYSQVLTSQSTDYVADYGRLAAEVDEEVRRLQDHQAALEEVKLGELY